MSSPTARLLKLEAQQDQPGRYQVAFEVDGQQFTMALDVDDEGVALNPDDALEPHLEFFSTIVESEDEEAEDKLEDEQRLSFIIGEFADFYAQTLAESGLVFPVPHDALGDEDYDEDEDEDAF